MKHLILIVASFIIAVPCFSQEYDSSDAQAVKQRIDDFFVALETQDTILYKNIVFINGQIWAVKQEGDSIKYSMRHFRDDIIRFNSEIIIQETPLDYEIKVHQQIAVAWVPYTLSISGNFSHCGVDIFTFIKTQKGWKIVNASFTIEPNGCEALKKHQK